MKLVKNEKGFGLIILILVVAIIGVSFGTYSATHHRNALKIKKQAEDQKAQIEKQVNDQLKQFESKVDDIEQRLPEDME